jgi:carboxylate-amine ligase
MEQSSDYTIGIEEEYQVVDAATGALRSSGSVVRNADWTSNIVPELQESTVEIGTPICASAASARDELSALRMQTATVAASEGLGIIAAGVHPFSRWEGHTRPDKERYRRIEARYGRIARDEHIFGMHIHVAIDPSVDRIPLMNVLRHYLPQMLALSTSSRFFEGEDTGFASFRSIIWRRWPSSGITPRFASSAEFDAYVDTLLASGVIHDRGNLYWSMRPHTKYPTIEFRVTDVCPNIDDAVAIAAYARALVAAIADGCIADTFCARVPQVLEQEILRVNEWRAAQAGLDARVIDVATGSTSDTVRSRILRTLDVIYPFADALGDSEALARVALVLERGTASDHLRRLYAERQSLVDLVEWLQAETLLGVGMDKRTLQRVG